MTLGMNRLILFLTLAAAAVGLAACGDDDGGSGSGDGDALVVYSGRNQDLVGDLLERYRSSTGAKLEIRYSDSADLAATLLEEGDERGAPQGHIVTVRHRLRGGCCAVLRRP